MHMEGQDSTEKLRIKDGKILWKVPVKPRLQQNTYDSFSQIFAFHSIKVDKYNVNYVIRWKIKI